MKIKNIMISIICVMIFHTTALALSDPVIDSVPAHVDADTYTLTINVDTGSKVTVMGGPSFIPPVTDGAGSDSLDGVVEVTVGLAQEEDNVFSVSAEKDGSFSDSVKITIHETGNGEEKSGDQTAPIAPTIDNIKNPIKAYEYEIKGSAEADANIYVEKGGTTVASTQANSEGFFHVKVDLEIGKTNRFNVFAEDAADNKGPASQAVIQAVQPDGPRKDKIKSEEKQGEVGQVAHHFTDISSHWAESYIAQVFNKGIVNGKTSVLFSPNANITRAELTKIAVKAFGFSVPEVITTKSFDDVLTDAWYAPYIQSAKENNLVGGFDNGKYFKPNQPITRAAALKILLSAADVDTSGGITVNFSDTNTSAWYIQYVNFAKNNDIVNGYPDGTFGPAKNITRAEVAKVVIKILDLVE